MDGYLDLAGRDESELLAMAENLDSRIAPINYSRLKSRLIELGFVATDTDSGRMSVALGPTRMIASLGDNEPIEGRIRLPSGIGWYGRLEPAHNRFQLTGQGTIRWDGLTLEIRAGKQSALQRLIGVPSPHFISIPVRAIRGTDQWENVVRIRWAVTRTEPQSLVVWCATDALARRLIQALPGEQATPRSSELEAYARFESAWAESAPHAPATTVLIGLNIIVYTLFVVMTADWHPHRLSLLIQWGANIGSYTLQGQWWRLFTSQYIHLGPIHLLWNMLALAIFGPLIEKTCGTSKMLLAYTATGVVSGLASDLWHPTVLSAGASGAICGLIGLLIGVSLTTPAPARPMFLAFRYMALAFIAGTLLNGLATVGIDNAAHVGGLLCGALLSSVIKRGA